MTVIFKTKVDLTTSKSLIIDML